MILCEGNQALCSGLRVLLQAARNLQHYDELGQISRGALSIEFVNSPATSVAMSGFRLCFPPAQVRTMPLPMWMKNYGLAAVGAPYDGRRGGGGTRTAPIWRSYKQHQQESHGRLTQP